MMAIVVWMRSRGACWTRCGGNAGREAKLSAAIAGPPSERQVTKVLCCAMLGEKWWEDNQSEQMWRGMTVSRLCNIVSGQIFPNYVRKMKRHTEWIDAMFRRELGVAHGVSDVDLPDRHGSCDRRV